MNSNAALQVRPDCEAAWASHCNCLLRGTRDLQRPLECIPQKLLRSDFHDRTVRHNNAFSIPAQNFPANPGEPPCVERTSTDNCEAYFRLARAWRSLNQLLGVATQNFSGLWFSIRSPRISVSDGSWKKTTSDLNQLPRTTFCFNTSRHSGSGSSASSL